MNWGKLAAAAAVTALAAACSSQPSRPPDVREIAAQAGAVRLSDCGPAPAGGVSDFAVAWRGATKVGIDTFPTQAVRDRWIKAAQGFGVVVLREGSTWVLYRATDQKTKGC